MATGATSVMLAVLAVVLPLVSIASPVAASSPAQLFTAYVGWDNPGGLAEVAKQLQHPVTGATAYVAYQSWSSIDDRYNLSPWTRRGYQMVWGVPMLPESGGTLAMGATGAYDKYFVSLATNLVRAGQGDAILRLGWEFNSRSFPWYAAGHAASFVAYWRKIVTAMRSVPGSHFRFDWNVNRGDRGASDAAMGKLARYYPGNRYVELVGMDVYDVQWRSYPGCSREFSDIVSQPWGLGWLARFARRHGRALSIPEFGLGWGTTTKGCRRANASGPISGADDAAFMTDVLAWASAHGVAELGLWDKGAATLSSTANPRAKAAAIAGLRSL